MNDVKPEALAKLILMLVLLQDLGRMLEVGEGVATYRHQYGHTLLA